MRRAYVFLLQLYPRDFGATFAAEMLSAFEEAAGDQRERGTAFYFRFALAELASLVPGIGFEWCAKLIYGVHDSHSYITGEYLPDLRSMRPPGISWEAHYGWPKGSARCTSDTLR